MPSLFSRLLGKKKQPDSSLLGGEKYENVQPPSPPPDKLSSSPPKGKENGKARRKPAIATEQKSTAPPALELTLPDTKFAEEKKTAGLGVVFEGITDGSPLLDEETIGKRRLSPEQTLYLVKKTSEVISERGLETLGVMRPHWFSSARHQEIQLKLISRFLHALAAPQANGSSEISENSPKASFESELRYTRDPQDVAAVLRWGLRHLQLANNSFGSSSTKDDWYRAFSTTESSQSFPRNAFDTILVPLLPPEHAELVKAVLDLVSSLAAHSEANGISGNKLSKVLGWWLVGGRDGKTKSVKEWIEFYKDWEATAREFEHLFLAYVRAHETHMPRRLTELVKHYPYAKNRREEDGIFLPRTRFSTRSAQALFIRVTLLTDENETETDEGVHPLRIVEDAFKAVPEASETDELSKIWESIRGAAFKVPHSKSVSQASDKENVPTEQTCLPTEQPTFDLRSIISDESIRLFTLVPSSPSSNPSANPSNPTLSLFPSIPRARPRPQSAISASGFSIATVTSTGAKDKEKEDVPDWQAFSSAGFRSPSGLSLAASLWDNDTEVSVPVSSASGKKPASGAKRALSVKSNGRAASDAAGEATPQASPTFQTTPTQTNPMPSNGMIGTNSNLIHSTPTVLKLDEAFIDFWADTLLEPSLSLEGVMSNWPNFVIAQLKSLKGSPILLPGGDRPVEWVIVERVVRVKEGVKSEVMHKVVPNLAATTTVKSKKEKTKTSGSDPKAASRWTMSPTKKRWSFFTGAAAKEGVASTSATVPAGGKDKKAAVGVKVGEMGEILKEEDEVGVNGVNNGEVKANGKEKENKVNRDGKEKEKAEEPVSKFVESMDTPPAATENKDEPLAALVEAREPVAIPADAAIPTTKEAPAHTRSEEAAAFAAAAAGPEVLVTIIEKEESVPIPTVESTPAPTAEEPTPAPAASHLDSAHLSEQPAPIISLPGVEALPPHMVLPTIEEAPVKEGAMPVPVAGPELVTVDPAVMLENPGTKAETPAPVEDVVAPASVETETAPAPVVVETPVPARVEEVPAPALVEEVPVPRSVKEVAASAPINETPVPVPAPIESSPAPPSPLVTPNIKTLQPEPEYPVVDEDIPEIERPLTPPPHELVEEEKPAGHFEREIDLEPVPEAEEVEVVEETKAEPEPVVEAVPEPTLPIVEEPFKEPEPAPAPVVEEPAPTPVVEEELAPASAPVIEEAAPTPVVEEEPASVPAPIIEKEVIPEPIPQPAEVIAPTAPVAAEPVAVATEEVEEKKESATAAPAAPEVPSVAAHKEDEPVQPSTTHKEETAPASS